MLNPMRRVCRQTAKPRRAGGQAHVADAGRGRIGRQARFVGEEVDQASARSRQLQPWEGMAGARNFEI